MQTENIVLFLPLSKANLLEMLPIAHALQEKDQLQPVVCLNRKLISLLELLDGIPAIRPDGAPLQKSPGAAPQKKEPSKPSAKQRVFSLLPQFFQSFMTLRSECRRVQKLFQKHPSIRLVIVSGDRNIGIETALIAEANRHNVTSLIVPFAMSFPEAAAEPRLRSGSAAGKYSARGPIRSIIRKMFPSWVRNHKGTLMFFQPPYTALAAHVLGIMPKTPWTVGGGSATKMAVESKALHDQLIDQGMDPPKMIVTGKPGLDAIAEQLATVKKEDKRRELGINPDEKVILCTVPQLAEHDLLTWERHRDEMRFLFQTLTESGARVILSLHPKSDRNWYQPLADEAGATIVDERIYGLLPICDVFVATYSSIVSQAIALHIPSIVIDFYDLLYPPYDSAPGASVIRERGSFSTELDRLLNDQSYYDTQVQQTNEQGEEWAMLDGKNTERVVAVAEKLMSTV